MNGIIIFRFDYNFLAPPLLDAELLLEFDLEASRRRKADTAASKGVKDAETAAENDRKMNARPETEALWYMSESKVQNGDRCYVLVVSG
jgi:hypothetical protein